MERKTYASGDCIFLEGEPADCAYLIEEGSVELTKRKDTDAVIISVVEKGEMIGEMALIDAGPRSLSARCPVKTTVLVIPKDEFDHRLDAIDPVFQRILLILIRRLRDQTQATTDKSTANR